MPDTDVAALILAAGFSHRFGRDKRELILSGGERMVDRVVHRVRAAGVTPFLVLRADDTLPVPADVAVLRSARAEEGMGSSLADGARQLPGHGTWRGCLVVLADMPWMRVDTISAVAVALAPGIIVVPEYRGERGHPVGFSAGLLGELCQLQGEQGARALLERHPQRVRPLAVADPGILRDVDRVADLLVTPPPP